MRMDPSFNGTGDMHLYKERDFENGLGLRSSSGNLAVHVLIELQAEEAPECEKQLI